MPSNTDWLNTILLGLGTLGGGLENRSQSANTTTTSGSVYNPADTAFYNSIRDKYAGLLNTDPDLKGYQNSGIQSINHASEFQNQTAQEQMAARGVSGPAFDANLRNLDAQRFATAAKFKNSIPLLARQTQEDTLSKALTAFGLAPKTTISSNVGNTSGNVAAGALGSFTKLAASPIGGSLLTTLAKLFGAGSGGGNAKTDQDFTALIDYINNSNPGALPQNPAIDNEYLRNLLLGNPGMSVGPL